MNAHKIQHTHARINCPLKDSNCDSPLSKILKFIILGSNASSISTKVLKCPHTKMTPQSHTLVQQYIAPESQTTLTFKKMNICMTSPIRLPLFFSQHLFQLSKDQKGLSRIVMGLIVKVWSFRISGFYSHKMLYEQLSIIFFSIFIHAQK